MIAERRIICFSWTTNSHQVTSAHHPRESWPQQSSSAAYGGTSRSTTGSRTPADQGSRTLVLHICLSAVVSVDGIAGSSAAGWGGLPAHVSGVSGLVP